MMTAPTIAIGITGMSMSIASFAVPCRNRCIQPSGELHIGNYLGAVKNWAELQRSYESFFCVVDYHAITVPYEPDDLRVRRREMTISLLAAAKTLPVTKRPTIMAMSAIPKRHCSRTSCKRFAFNFREHESISMIPLSALR